MNRPYIDEFATRGKRMSYKKSSRQSASSVNTFISDKGFGPGYGKEGLGTGIGSGPNFGAGLCCTIF